MIDAVAEEGQLSQIGRSAGQALSDPTVSAIARTALPIAGGALGTVIGGPVGTALGTQLGTLAAGALPPQQVPRPPAAPRPGVIPAPPAPARAPRHHRWPAGLQPQPRRWY